MTHSTRMSETVKVSEGGRIVLPAKVRRALDLKCGDELLLRVEDGEIRLFTRLQGIRRAQRLLAPYAKGQGSLVDEFIAERRAEAAREELD